VLYIYFVSLHYITKYNDNLQINRTKKHHNVSFRVSFCGLCVDKLTVSRVHFVRLLLFLLLCYCVCNDKAADLLFDSVGLHVSMKYAMLQYTDLVLILGVF